MMRTMIHIENPYNGASKSATWLLGNLHTHTTRSDGTRPPQEVIDDYAKRGYDFLMISDHDICTSPEDYQHWDSRGMVMIPGNEISAAGPHLLHVNADSRVDPVPDRQGVIDRCTSGRSFAIVNHPNWGENFAHCKQEFLETWRGYAGIEIYNGICEYLPGSGFATDRWDQLLSAGRRIWGFANDDHHWHDQKQIEMGWNAVLAEKNLDNIIAAMKVGRFYASTGVQIEQIEVNSDKIAIQTQNADRIIARSDFGRRFADTEGSSIQVQIPDGATYVRFDCHGPNRSFAWTQPFFIRLG